MRVRILAAAGGLGLLLTACSGEAPAPTPSPAASSVAAPKTSSGPDLTAATKWFDGYCGAIHGFRQKNNDSATQGSRELVLDGSAKAQRALSDELGQYASLAGDAADQLGALGPAPDPAAEAARKSFADKYGSARDKSSDAKKALDAAKPGTKAQETASSAMIAAQQILDGAYDPLGPLASAPQPLLAAAAAAPKCRPAS